MCGEHPNKKSLFIPKTINVGRTGLEPVTLGHEPNVMPFHHPPWFVKIAKTARNKL